MLVACELGMIGQHPDALFPDSTVPASGIRQARQPDEHVALDGGCRVPAAFQMNGSISARCPLSVVQLVKPYERAVTSWASASENRGRLRRRADGTRTTRRECVAIGRQHRARAAAWRLCEDVRGTDRSEADVSA